MNTIRFTIPGEPVGAPRMTQADKWKRRPCVVRYRNWKDAARKAAGWVPNPEHILSVSWVAYFSPAASWSKKRKVEAIGQLHRMKPDRDNIDKALLDALFIEDCAIASGTIEKRWDIAERMEVTITFTNDALKQ